MRSNCRVQLSRADEGPISATLLVIAMLLLAFVLLPNIRKQRDVAFEAED